MIFLAGLLSGLLLSALFAVIARAEIPRPEAPVNKTCKGSPPRAIPPPPPRPI